MPIFFQQQIDGAELAIWNIREEGAFFASTVSVSSEIRHPHKRLQHFAGRYLLKHLRPDFPLALIRIADTRRPYLADELYHFSISHCDDYAAAVVSSTNRVGVDIETIRPKIITIQHKFTTGAEQMIVMSLADSLQPAQAYTLIWCAKEAVFKWYGLGGVDFKDHIQIQSITRLSQAHGNINILFTKDAPVHLIIHYVIFDKLTLCSISM